MPLPSMQERAAARGHAPSGTNFARHSSLPVPRAAVARLTRGLAVVVVAAGVQCQRRAGC